MVAKKIRGWELPFITLTEDTEIPENVYELDYIRVNRIDNSIARGWNSVFDAICSANDKASETIKKFDDVVKEVWK